MKKIKKAVTKPKVVTVHGFCSKEYTEKPGWDEQGFVRMPVISRKRYFPSDNPVTIKILVKK